MNEPILAACILPAGDGYSHPRQFTVHGGLNFLRGNSAPYFSITYWAHRVGHKTADESGGAGHDEILKHFPQFADLAALHLSDINGVPMHAEGNGWYKLAGSLPDGFGDRYHAGNSPQNFPIAPPADKPWKDTEHRLPTGDECLAMFADHCRIPLAEARKIRQSVMTRAMNSPSDRLAVAKARLAEIMADMRPRWKAEAAACIAKHGLVVYGDPWVAPKG